MLLNNVQEIFANHLTQAVNPYLVGEFAEISMSFMIGSLGNICFLKEFVGKEEPGGMLDTLF